MQFLFKRVGREIRDAMLLCGVGPKLQADDRDVLELEIFPALEAESQWKRVLFVGCHWYTWHYPKLLPSKEFVTIEINPARRRYGASRHVVDSVEHLHRHFEKDSFEIVIMTGVIGWGLDEPDAANRTLLEIHDVLQPGGLMLLGCDSAPEHAPFDVCDLPAIEQFQPWTFPAWGSHRKDCDGDLGHYFLFYESRKLRPHA
ncbi:MAG: class I SAM-dependent methyltransferase [Planctomycetales bacterium]|nr:class I SAM-dependent methyltransferase [Planctomycetales bacterium]